MADNNSKTARFTKLIAVVPLIAYLLAAFVWIKPLPALNYDYDNEAIECELHAIIRDNQRSFIRLNRASLYSGALDTFDDGGFVVESAQDTGEATDELSSGCSFFLTWADFDQERFQWVSSNSAYAPESSFSLEARVESQAHGSVFDNEMELLLDGVFFVQPTSIGGVANPGARLIAANEASRFETQAACTQLVDSYGSFVGRLICPLSFVFVAS